MGWLAVVILSVSTVPSESRAAVPVPHHDRGERFYGNPLVGVRPTEGRMIDDPTGTWSGASAILIYDSGTGDQANPSSVELSPGHYLTLGYNTNTSQLFGVFTADTDYR